jgi:hypothetical protein
MPKKGSTTYTVTKGADGKFKSVKKSRAPAARQSKPKAKARATSSRKRVATPKQLAALQKARMVRSGRSLKSKYGAGGAYGLGFDGDLAVQGPAGPPTALGSAVSSLVDPYADVKKGVNPYAL